MTEQEVADFERWLREEADIAEVRMFPEAGIWTGISRLIFHWTLKLGQVGDRIGYEDQWCYATEAMARRALAEWDASEGGEPTGWHRHPASGRRRPDGDPAREYVER